MRLRLLDRYVLKELLYPFAFGVAAFSSIFVASTMLFKITEYITKYGAPLETIANDPIARKYYLGDNFSM